MTRRKRTTRQRAKIFTDHGGLCHICKGKIDGTKERWELEHIVPYELTRDDTDENIAPAHVGCHKKKTATDKGKIAKSARVNAKHIGAAPQSKAPLPGGRKSKWKRKVGGGWVAREE